MRTNDVVCVGSVFLDYVVSLESIPKKPIKVKAKRIEKKLGGSAAVASFTIKRLGVQSEFVGRFGDDDGSNFLKSEFDYFNVNYKKSLSIKKSFSSQSYVFQDSKGERLLAAYNEKKLLANKSLPEFIFSNKKTYLVDLSWIEAACYITKKTHGKKINCIADMDNFKKNKKIEQIVNKVSHPIFSETGLFEYTKIKSIIRSLKYLYNKKNKFYGVTLGSKGVYWVDNNVIYHCLAPKIKAVETNGAGDVFHGAFAAFIHQKMTIEESVELATATASLKCTKAGGIRSVPNYKSVKQFVKKIKTSAVGRII